MLQSCCGKNACGSHALVVELEGGASRDIRGNASCWPARRQVHLLSHLPGSGSAAVRQCFVCSFQVTPGSSGRLRSDPGNEGINLALFTLAAIPAAPTGHVTGLPPGDPSRFASERGCHTRDALSQGELAAFNGVVQSSTRQSCAPSPAPELDVARYRP